MKKYYHKSQWWTRKKDFDLIKAHDEVEARTTRGFAFTDWVSLEGKCFREFSLGIISINHIFSYSMASHKNVTAQWSTRNKITHHSDFHPTYDSSTRVVTFKNNNRSAFDCKWSRAVSKVKEALDKSAPELECFCHNLAVVLVGTRSVDVGDEDEFNTSSESASTIILSQSSRAPKVLRTRPLPVPLPPSYVKRSCSIPDC